MLLWLALGLAARDVQSKLLVRANGAQGQHASLHATTQLKPPIQVTPRPVPRVQVPSIVERPEPAAHGAFSPGDRRGLYVSIWSDKPEPVASRILGDAEKESQLLQYCQDYGINALTLYDGYPATGSKAADLRSFIRRARAQGIGKVEVAVSASERFWRQINDYNVDSEPLERFDGAVTEIEYWNHAGEGPDEILGAVRYGRDDLGIPGRDGDFTYAAYLGWVPLEDMPALCAGVDEVWLHAYVPSPSRGPGYVRSRADACGGGRIVTIWSAEGEAYHDDQAFMGDWVAAHRPDPIDEAEDAYRARAEGDAALNNAVDALEGFQWFAYHYLRFYSEGAAPHNPGPAEPCADYASWPDLDGGVVCGDCTVLVDDFDTTYGTCEAYCQSIGRRCVAAWEESGDTCEVKHDLGCGESIDSSDALCKCSPDSEA